MTNPPDVLSRAIVLHLGKGRSAFPRSDDDAVRAAWPSADAGLLDEVRAIESECLAIEVEWRIRSLPQAGDDARAIMAHRHPLLDDEALDALRWMFTYNWR